MSDLMVRLPEFWQSSPQAAELQRVLGLLTDGAGAALEETLAQFFPQTAYGWGLRLWEEAYGLPVDLSRPTDYRRSRVISKLRGQGTSTAALLREVAESFDHGQVEIEEHNGEYYFVVRFTSRYGVPPNLDDLQAALDEIKPAHLDYIFAYLYRTWGQVKGWTWGELKGYTWGAVREGEMV